MRKRVLRSICGMMCTCNKRRSKQPAGQGPWQGQLCGDPVCEVRWHRDGVRDGQRRGGRSAGDSGGRARLTGITGRLQRWPSALHRRLATCSLRVIVHKCGQRKKVHRGSTSCYAKPTYAKPYCTAARQM